MNTKIKMLLILLFVLVYIIIPGNIFAQGPGFDDDVIDEVPLDGGVGALVVAGVAYGVKKIRGVKKQ